jgi:hypothetical protein
MLVAGICAGCGGNSDGPRDARADVERRITQDLRDKATGSIVIHGTDCLPETATKYRCLIRVSSDDEGMVVRSADVTYDPETGDAFYRVETR